MERKLMKGFEGDKCPDCGLPFGQTVCCKAEAKRLTERRLVRLLGPERAQRVMASVK